MKETDEVKEYNETLNEMIQNRDIINQHCFYVNCKQRVNCLTSGTLCESLKQNSKPNTDKFYVDILNGFKTLFIEDATYNGLKIRQLIDNLIIKIK